MLQRITEPLRLEKPSKLIESNHSLTLPNPSVTYGVPRCHIYMFFWTLQGMVIPPLTDNIHNNIRNIHFWNLVGRKKKEGCKEKQRILPSLGPPKNGLLSSEASYASWWATSKREACRSPESSALCCDMGQEGAFHHLSHPVHVHAWTHQGGSYWFSQREDTFNGMKVSLERETFSFFLPTQRYPWLWQEWPRKQVRDIWCLPLQFCDHKPKREDK